MKDLKFALDFVKLHGQTSAKLIGMSFVKKSELSDNFLDYDLFDKNNKSYDLVGDCFLLLVFLGNDNIPFTTLRNPDKLDKYNLGEYYNIKILK